MTSFKQTSDASSPKYPVILGKEANGFFDYTKDPSKQGPGLIGLLPLCLSGWLISIKFSVRHVESWESLWEVEY